MYARFTPFILLLVAYSSYSQTSTFHDYKGNTITGVSLNFSAFYGKKVMVVNTASYCTWTYQYEALENLYEEYKDSNFVIIGFPCNDWLDQEPGTDSTINEFCTEVYGITFQMMSKIAIVSHDTAEVYKWLQREDLNGVSDGSVSWNFNKFLIDEAGHWVAHYTNGAEPDDPAIIAWLKTPSVIHDTIDTTSTGIRDIDQIKMNISMTESGMSLSFDHLTKQNTSISLLSLNGQLVSKLFDGIPSEHEVMHLDLAGFTKGMYLLHVKNERDSRVFKLPVVR